MKKDDIKLGGTYMAKVTDRVVPVRLDRENPRGGWDATNLVTNKQIRIKSAQRLRGPARDDTKTKTAEGTNADLDRVPLTEVMKKPAKGTKAPKAEKPAKTPKPEKPARKPSGLDAAAKVLADKGEPMRCGDIVETMINTGLWETNGKTPAATIYAAILREIQTKGAEARFKKTDRGLFTVKGK
jgi:hypothetical protein